MTRLLGALQFTIFMAILVVAVMVGQQEAFKYVTAAQVTHDFKTDRR